MATNKSANNKTAHLESEHDFSELLHERERDDSLNEQLETMYAAEVSGSGMVERAAANPWRRISIVFIILLIVLSAVSWASFFLLNDGQLASGEQVALAIEGPDELRAGEEAVYEIRYRNVSEFILEEALLAVTIPENAYIVDAVPAYDSVAPPAGRTLQWRLDGVPGNHSGKIAIKVAAIDAAGVEAPLTAHMRYRPENFSSLFSSQANAMLRIAETGLHTALDAPSFVNVNDEVSMAITYAQTQGSMLREAVVWLEYGEYFQPTEGQDFPLLLSDLAETPQEMEITGTFTAMPRSGEAVVVHVGIPTPAGAEERYATIAQYQWEPTVVSGALQLSATVNGSASGRPINFGEILRYVIHYKNTSDTALEQVALLAVVDSPLVDWNTVSEERGGDVRDNAIVWTAEEISGLERLAPGAEGSVSFNVALKGLAAARLAGTVDAFVTMSADYSVGGDPTQSDMPATQVRVPVNSDFAFNETVRYFGPNGSSIGSGPWPPQAGEETTVQAQWVLTNSWHDLSNVEVVATLPDYVRWAGAEQVTQGSLDYNEETRTIRWTMSQLGAAGEPGLATFSLAITPRDDQRGTAPQLLSEARSEAKDTATGGVIVRSAPAVTTSLLGDTSATSGTVR